MTSASVCRVARRPAPPLIETADTYARVVAASGRWRIVWCAGDLQWILQRRRRAERRARPWEGVAYIYDPAALPTVLARPSLGISLDDLRRLLTQWEAGQTRALLSTQSAGSRAEDATCPAAEAPA